MPNKFFEITLTDLINTIFNGTTFLLAYLIYRNFDVKKTYVNRQLETVLSLLEEINKTSLNVQFKTKIPQDILEKIPKLEEDQPKYSWYGSQYTLFSIAELVNSRQKFGNIYTTSEVQNIMPFLRFINNPLLPNSIVEKLSLFYSPITNYSTFDKTTDSFISINNNNTIGKHNSGSFYQYPDFAEAYGSWDDFIRCTKELKREIETWLQKHGAKDINFNYTSIKS